MADNQELSSSLGSCTLSPHDFFQSSLDSESLCSPPTLLTNSPVDEHLWRREAISDHLVPAHLSELCRPAEMLCLLSSVPNGGMELLAISVPQGPVFKGTPLPADFTHAILREWVYPILMTPPPRNMTRSCGGWSHIQVRVLIEPTYQRNPFRANVNVCWITSQEPARGAIEASVEKDGSWTLEALLTKSEEEIPFFQENPATGSYSLTPHPFVVKMNPMQLTEEVRRCAATGVTGTHHATSIV